MQRWLLLLAGLIAAPVWADEELPPSVVAAMEGYYSCSVDAAYRLLNEASTAYEIADATVASCEDKLNELRRESTETQWLSDEAAHKMAREQRGIVRQQTVRLVVEKRAKK